MVQQREKTRSGAATQKMDYEPRAYEVVWAVIIVIDPARENRGKPGCW